MKMHLLIGLSLIVSSVFYSSFGNAVSAPSAEAELTSLIRNTKGARSDAVIVYKDGNIIYQNYAREHGPNIKHLSWSTAKTISGILIGIAESEGLLSYHDQVKKYFPEIKTEARISDLLAMSSGLKYKEVFTGLPKDLDVTKMMYLKGPSMGFAGYMTKLPLSPEGNPGDYFNYSSGDTSLLMAILQKSIGDQSKYDKYPWEKFFNLMNIDATFEQDSKGTFVGASYIYMTPLDFLKVGKLLMHRGMWNGKRIIPEKYFLMMNIVAEGVQKKVQKGNPEWKAYSSHVTTNLPIEGRHLNSRYNDLPLDALIMIGHQGQLIVASPSQDLVILRLAMDRKELTSMDFYAAVKKFILSKNLKYETVGSQKINSHFNQETDEKSMFGTVLNIPNLLRAYSAKEYCSCRLVIGRSDLACRDDLKAQFPVLPKLKIKNDGSVTATLGLGIFKKSRAVYHGKLLGCTLTESE